MDPTIQLELPAARSLLVGGVFRDADEKAVCDCRKADGTILCRITSELGRSGPRLPGTTPCNLISPSDLGVLLAPRVLGLGDLLVAS
jgi:hypothetical protein